MHYSNIKTLLFYSFVVVVCLTACKKTSDANNNPTNPIAPVDTEGIQHMPYAKANIGQYPFYITLPEGYQYNNLYHEMNFDEVYHFYNDSSTLAIGGRFFETAIIQPQNNTKKPYSDSLIIAHFKKNIQAIGGRETQLKHKYWTEKSPLEVDSVKRFIIRTLEGNIWIDLFSLKQPRHVAYSVIYEGQTHEFPWIIKAERLKYSLENFGKAVVYVNFKEAQTTLQPIGIKAVDEIARLFEIDKDIKISIEGHTDNAGTPEYCKRLSAERNRSIENRLKEKKVGTEHLKFVAYGSSRMITDNSTNDAKARNRRIELIKINVDESAMKKAIEQDGKAILQITFESGKSIIKPEGLEIVDEIAKLMINDPQLKLSIEGHTDNVGSAIMNKKLSIERAQAVVNRLVELKIERNRLQPTGFGLERPMVPNNTAENKEKNRRVEIVKINK